MTQLKERVLVCYDEAARAVKSVEFTVLGWERRACIILC